jgi:hypothetical protein
MGIVALIGLKSTLAFFTKKSKLQGSIFYFLGFFMIIIGWYMFTFLGFLAQMYGLFLLFRSFLSTILMYAETLPVIGPCLKKNEAIHKAVRKMEESDSDTKKRKRAEHEV